MELIKAIIIISVAIAQVFIVLYILIDKPEVIIKNKSDIEYSNPSI